MAVGHFYGPDYEGNVELGFADLTYDLVGTSLKDVEFDLWMLVSIPAAQIGEEARSDRRQEADRQVTDRAVQNRPCGLDCKIEMANPSGDFRDETAAGVGQTDATMAALEQNNTKILLQRLDPGTHARLADAESIRGVTKIQMLGNRQRLDQRHERDAASQQRILLIDNLLAILRSPPHCASYLAKRSGDR